MKMFASHREFHNSNDCFCLFDHAGEKPILSRGLAKIIGVEWGVPIEINRLFQKSDVVQLQGALAHLHSGKAVVQLRTGVLGRPRQRLEWSLLHGLRDDEVLGQAHLVSDADSLLAVLKPALEALPDGLAVYDAENRLLYSNRAFRDGEARRTGRGKMQPDPQPVVEMGTVGPAIHIGLTSGGGHLRILDAPLPKGGRVRLWGDVTELEEARRKAVAASQAKSNFLSTVNHELRTPLTALLGMLELLDDEADDANRQRMIAQVRRSGETLRDIINDVLDVLKIEAGAMRLEQMAFQPVDVLNEVVARHQAIALKKGLNFAVHVDAPTGHARHWDPLRFGQILDNLIGNAIKFTPCGRIDVELIDIPGNSVRIVVRDTGIGMSPEALLRIGQPYEQAAAGTARVYGGSGLGLSIVMTLANLAGGTLSIESAPGEGSQFTVDLPLPPAVEAKSAATPAAFSNAALSGQQVLIAEDDAIIREVLTGYLTKAGATVTAVTNGCEAVATAIAGAFDLILLDNAMPEMSGLEAMKAIRARLGKGCPPLIVATASSLDHEIKAFLDAGFDLHLAKPFRKDDIGRLLATLARP